MTVEPNYLDYAGLYCTSRVFGQSGKWQQRNNGGLRWGWPGITAQVHSTLSLYGMGRFPVTLYKEQWVRLLTHAAEIEAFIRENDSKLKTQE